VGCIWIEILLKSKDLIALLCFENCNAWAAPFLCKKFLNTSLEERIKAILLDG